MIPCSVTSFFHDRDGIQVKGGKEEEKKKEEGRRRPISIFPFSLRVVVFLEPDNKRKKGEM